ncbi:hypothetical protein Pmar_PMAR014672 [Perkinsus marinus ATCC 50983]|uniref:Uncharacterized protein n=1 Tax=Perkinsus marinus (strain ATCC 50983 / TXsc) TaxID=423536 RepID=C5LIQ0_PERM5|nr:hypothetical protein Pmar_PMAR014672 [Perkinsus marinus ATCC 50983]EER03453.1 hypothetical protein Pmar_PMAR014672 [Perkinsus marinus ATCC 50983]|eukprot:XP_002771637.1 hypothetical protein Pmar_PMAR014672 [Perkinsus marinus ATCC 50983]
MSEPSKELNAEVKAPECIDSSMKDKAEPSSRVEVNREALSGYDELVTEEDIYALERSRRGPRRPSWKLLNPPRKRSGEQANPIVVLLGS